MSGLAGTIEKFILNGTNFLVAADINVTQNQGTENTFLPTSGEAMPQVIKKNATAEGFSVSTDGAAYSNLRALHKKTSNGEMYSLAYVTAGGLETYVATGGINITQRTTENNVADVALMPLADWELLIV